MTGPRLTEAEFQDQVMELAEIRGWMTMHQRPARTVTGWRTAISGAGKGWPDLTLLRGDRMIFAELKTDRGRVTPDQQRWLTAIAETRNEVYVWRPAQFDEIKELLT